jgi:hypothetical protein
MEKDTLTDFRSRKRRFLISLLTVGVLETLCIFAMLRLPPFPNPARLYVGAITILIALSLTIALLKWLGCPSCGKLLPNLSVTNCLKCGASL